MRKVLKKFNLILLSLVAITFLSSALLCFKIYASPPELDSISLASGNYLTSGDKSLFEVDEETNIVIEPGKSDSFTFRLKNPTENILVYALRLMVSFDFDSQELKLLIGDKTYNPILIKMKNYEGDYIVGSETTYEGVDKLADIVDTVNLESNQYAYYTIEYIWPYESGADDLDTIMGNFAVNHNLFMSLNIQALIEQELIVAKPKTSNPIVIVAIVCGIVLALLVIVLLKSSQRIVLVIGDKVKYKCRFKDLPDIPDKLKSESWFKDKEFTKPVDICGLSKNPKILYMKETKKERK